MNNTETRVIVVPSEYDQILDQLADAVPYPLALAWAEAIKASAELPLAA